MPSLIQGSVHRLVKRIEITRNSNALEDKDDEEELEDAELWERGEQCGIGMWSDGKMLRNG